MRALPACLLLAATMLTPATALGQALTSDMMRPVRGGFLSPADNPLRRVGEAQPQPQSRSDARRPNDTQADDSDVPAPSRIGRIPTYETPAAAGSGNASIGYDSLNRKRQRPKLYPGQKPPRAPGPGTPAPPEPLVLVPTAPVPPPSVTAHKPPVPPALAGTVVGQPPRKRLKVDEDPFGAVGDYAGSFLVKSAVEVSGGYDSNPGRISVARGSPFYVVAPELLVVSDWERHALVADLRGSFTGFSDTFPATTSGVTSAPTVLDRPDFTGHIDGRLDVSHDTRLLGELRLRVATDNPGSPNIQAGLARYPVYATLGTTLGIDQTFNRLQVSAGATADRTVYQESKLTDGTFSNNDDRNFSQYGGVGRVSYDVMPGLKPFAEVEADTRVHDIAIDRNGYRRDSDGGYAKVGSSFELTRLITGEASIGYAARTYTDPRLQRLEGLLTSASLVWAATGLTTAKFIATTSVDESTLSGVSGVLSRSYTAEVDHDFRRWLTGIGKFTWGTLDYQGSTRFDRFYAISGDLVWKLNRSLWVKGEVRHEWLDSNITGASNQATVLLLGVRLQN